MHFKVINDEYYNEIIDRLRSIVEEFYFDETDELYLIMFEFSQFIIDNVNNEGVFVKCCQFIDDAILRGKDKTEDIIVTQVFQPLYNCKDCIELCRKYFNSNSLLFFEKYLKEYLKDYEAPH